MPDLQEGRKQRPRHALHETGVGSVLHEQLHGEMQKSPLSHHAQFGRPCGLLQKMQRWSLSSEEMAVVLCVHGNLNAELIRMNPWTSRCDFTSLRDVCDAKK